MLDPLPHREVAQREHVLAAQREDEVHPRGPLADAADLGERGDDCLVARVREPLPRQIAVAVPEGRRDVPQVLDLRAAEPRLAEVVLVGREHEAGRRITTQYVEEPLVDRRRRGGRELLVHDRGAEARELVAGGFDRQGTVSVDQPRHRRVLAQGHRDSLVHREWVGPRDGSEFLPRDAYG